MQYKMIRGQRQRERCTDPIKGRLYCDCGCQEPQHDDPQPDLTDLIVTGRANHGYANYILTHRATGVTAGEINTQYSALFLDGCEFLGCDRGELAPIYDQIFINGEDRFDRPDVGPAGDTLEDTAATVRVLDRMEEAEENDRNKHHPGWCPKCHSYCYGDCEA